jgi:type IV pilus assembly protein PilF
MWLRLACLCGVLLSLTACGNLPGASASSGRDIVTSSDEPEARRRARIRMELAVGYFEQGQTNVALDEVKQVLAMDPTFPEAYNLRGLVYMRLNEMRLAEDSFRRAVALDPRDANTQHNLGWLLCQQNRYDESLAAFKQVLSNPLYTGQAKTWMAQGLCQARAGRKADAEASLAHAYELDAVIRSPATTSPTCCSSGAR